MMDSLMGKEATVTQHPLHFKIGLHNCGSCFFLIVFPTFYVYYAEHFKPNYTFISSNYALIRFAVISKSFCFICLLGVLRASI